MRTALCEQSQVGNGILEDFDKKHQFFTCLKKDVFKIKNIYTVTSIDIAIVITKQIEYGTLFIEAAEPISPSILPNLGCLSQGLFYFFWITFFKSGHPKYAGFEIRHQEWSD